MGVTYSSAKMTSAARKGSFTDLGKQSELDDIDIYFVLQIAKNLRDYDLQQKIDLEIKMREGTTKLLAACKHPVQSLEASKSLLTSNERMNAYIAELQQRKASEKNGNFKNCCANVEASKARVSVSEIRIPLIWKDTDHFKNKGDYRRFAVFCLLKIGTEIYDTALMNYVDRSMTDVSFDDIVVFHHVPSDFKLKLEVYSKVIQDDLSIASTPRKIKKKISSSVSRTFGRKLAASLKDEFSENGPKFDLIAEATLTLDDANDCVRTHDLVIDSENRQSSLPLFGHFCCRLAVNPDCINEERISNYLRVSEKSDHHSPKEWPVYWASLKNFKLYLWKKRLADMMETKMQTPDIIIPINKNTTVKAIKPSVFNITSNENKTYSLFVLNEHDLQLWTDHIKQHIEDYVSWKSAAENVMEIPSPTPSRTNMILRQRVPGSLYDETPLNDFPSSISCDGISPSMALRSRSSSMSSSGTCSSSTTNSNSLEKHYKCKTGTKFSFEPRSSTLTRQKISFY